MPVTLLALLSVALVAFVLTLWLQRAAPRLGLVDHPNARSSHVRVTPRGGGLGFVVAWVVALGIAWLAAGFEDYWIVVALATAAVAAVGLWDDRKGLSPGLRLACHLAASAIVVAALPAVPWPAQHLPDMVAAGLLTIAVAWTINLFNFMDGIDGLAASEAAFCAAALGGLALWQGQPWEGVPAWLLAAAIAGFLPANWPPAKIFMGDVGSGFLGLALAALALELAASGVLPLEAVVILPALFVVDATVTLLRRALRRARVHEAHRSHAYQRLARRYGSHQAVTLRALAVNLCWVLPCAIAACLWADYRWAAVVACYLPLGAIAVAAGAGTEDPE
jgi:Fuc2NAc and GlcNAc transferase